MPQAQRGGDGGIHECHQSANLPIEVVTAAWIAQAVGVSIKTVTNIRAEVRAERTGAPLPPSNPKAPRAPKPEPKAKAAEPKAEPEPVAAPPPAGKLSPSRLMEIVRAIDPKAADYLEAETVPELAEHGGDHKSEAAKVDQAYDVSLKSKHGNSSAYLAARLKRDRPDLHAQIGLYNSASIRTFTI